MHAGYRRSGGTVSLLIYQLVWVVRRRPVLVGPGGGVGRSFFAAGAGFVAGGRRQARGLGDYCPGGHRFARRRMRKLVAGVLSTPTGLPAPCVRE
jgi:hypothetical protein